MALHNVRLPVDVERGAKGGPGFKTTVTVLANGFEQRNIDWAQQRSEYDVSYGIGTKQHYKVVLNFFYVRRGKAFGFRFKDWVDYLSERGSIGTGTGVKTAFQLVKLYTDAGGTYARNIHCPVQGTLKIWKNNVLQTETTHYTVNYTTGVVTFLVAPTNGHAIEAEMEFDVPVRFDTDSLMTVLQWVEAGQTQSIPLVELRQEELV